LGFFLAPVKRQGSKAEDESARFAEAWLRRSSGGGGGGGGGAQPFALVE
jgi:hypothetical protein